MNIEHPTSNIEHRNGARRIGFLLLVHAIWWVFLIVIAGALRGADLQRGQTFVDGQRITAAQLQALVDNGTIVPGFYTGKQAQTNLNASDLLLIYSPSLAAFYKVTAAAALTQNGSFVNGQPEKTNAANNDFALVYDSSGGTLVKVAVSNLLVIANQPAITAWNTNYTFVATDGSKLWKITWADMQNYLSTNWQGFLSLTNADIARWSTPSSGDLFWVYDAAGASNKVMTWLALKSNVTALASGFLLGGNTNGAGTNVGMGTGLTLSNNLLAVTRFTSTNFALPTARGMITNAHGLGVVPSVVRAVLVCVTNELGYVTNNEVPLPEVLAVSSGGQVMFTMADATNVYTLAYGDLTFEVFDRGTPANGLSAITKNKWRVKIVAQP